MISARASSTQRGIWIILVWWQQDDVLARRSLDPKLVTWLGSQFGVIAKTLTEIDLRDSTDVELFAAARRFGSIVIVSKDSDFADLVTNQGKPPQVLWLRIRNQRTAAIQVVLRKAFPDALKLLEAGEALVEIVEDNGN